MKVNEIPVKQNANQVTDPSTQVSAEEFNALVDNAKESVTSMEVLAGEEEVKLSYGKGKGTSSVLTLPTATAAGAGMMSPKQAARIADRTATDGMGYVVLDKGKTFAEQVTQENTIYEIRYDFDLGGRTKEIPASCVLKFEGGSLKNGTLNGNASLITGCEYNILDGVYLNGTWANAECNLRWWGCSPASGVDNSPMIRYAFGSEIKTIRVSEVYGVSSPIQLPRNRKIVGCSLRNNKFTGFYANDDFSSISVKIPGSSSDVPVYEGVVSAIFYHRETYQLTMNELYIDARYKADFAIEHIDQYSDNHFFNLYIIGAKKAGILQNASEFTVYDHLYVSKCHIGIMVSNFKYVDTNPMDDSFYSGERLGQANLLVMRNVRCLHNNYGIILNGLYDGKCENLETAYNSVAGLVAYNSTVDTTKYYSEGDANCNFYIKELNGVWGMVYHDAGTGTEVVDTNEYHNTSSAYALPYLVDNNLDGRKTVCIQSKQTAAYLRSPVFSINSHLRFTSAMVSFHPRSYVHSNTDTYENFTVRDAHGIDAMMLVGGNGGSLHIGHLKKYVLSGGYKETLYASIIESNAYGAKINVENSNAHVEVVTVARKALTGEPESKDIRTWNISCGGSKRLDFNHDLETARRDLYYQLKNEMAATYVDTYDNRPLYKYEGAHTKYMWINKADFATKFKGRKVVMASITVKVIEETTTRLGITVAYFNSSYAGVSNYNSNQGNPIVYAPGYYKLELPVILDTFFDFDFIGVSLDLSNTESNIAVSHIYFYEMEDGIKAPHNFTAVTLQKGTTAQRPNPSFAGQQYFDTTLGKPIWWNGTAWVDNAGATV